MSEEEKTHIQIIEDIITAKMKPVWWMMAICLTIFVAISAPLTAVVISLATTQSTKANTTDVDEKFKWCDKTYLQKLQYYQIEADEHRMLMRLFNDAALSAYIFGQINDNIASELGFKYTTRGNGPG